MDALSFVKSNWGTIATVLFLISELLAGIPAIKSNSVFGLLRELFKGEAKKSEQQIVEAITKNEAK